MEKHLLFLLSAVMINLPSFAQRIKQDKVPIAVVKAFENKFPGAKKTTWEMEKASEYEATFRIGSVEKSANFSVDGNWLETETEIHLAGLPQPIQQALKTQFGGYKILEASFLENVKDGLCYEVEVKKGKDTFDVLFSPSGKVISQKKTGKRTD